MTGAEAQTATAPATGTGAGSSAVGTAAAQFAVTFTIGTSGTLGTTKVLTTGLSGLDFTLGTGSTCTGTPAANSTCVVKVAFTPQAPGQRVGAVELTNSSGTVIATALVFGTGTGSLATLTPGTINTIAGNGTAGYTGSTAPTSAELNGAQGIAIDAGGNVYIADTQSGRVLKLSGGLVTSYAGGGTGGNGGAATAASLSGPVGLALDGAGNLYILEATAGDIRVVTLATGLISTLASGGSNPRSMALDTSGNVYVAITGNNVIAKVTPTGANSVIAGSPIGLPGFLGDGGPATLALLNGPAGIGLDAAGNVYVADTGNQRIRKITVSSGVITTVAGSSSTAGFSGDGGSATSATLSSPAGQILMDAAGDFFFADAGNARVRKVAASNQYITTIAGNGGSVLGDGGAATSASLNQPIGLAFDANDNLYISDSSNQRLRVVTAAAFPLTFASTQVNSTSSDSPMSVLVNDNGNVALTFAVPSAGVNPAITAGYALGSGSCPQISAMGNPATLAIGASCTESVSFKPTIVSATNSGSLTITDDSNNSVGATQVIALSGVSTGTVTTTALALNPASGVTSGQTVTLTATLSPSTSTGTVIFYDNNVAISGAIAVSSGTATYADTAVTLGSHSFTASVTGTGAYAASSSTAHPLTVTTNTTTTLSLNPSSRVIAGQTVALAAMVFPSGSTGSVIFSDNGTAISGAVTVSGGTAGFADTNIAMGNHSFTAAFTGTGGYNNSTSSASVLFVSGVPAQLVVVGVPTASHNGVVESFTVTVVDSSGNTVTGFTGTVTITSSDGLASFNGSSPYTFQASDNGVHTFSVTFGTAGTQTITATSGSLTGSETGITVDDTLVLINSNGTASQLAENGAGISGASGYTGGGAPTVGLAVDASGNFFSLSPASNVLVEYNRTGTPLSGSGYTGGGLNAPAMLAVDGAGKVWVTNGNGSLSLFSNTGTALSPSTGFASGGYSSPTGIAIDLSGDVWVANSGNNTVTEVIGAAAPAAPLSTAVTKVITGARP